VEELPISVGVKMEASFPELTSFGTLVKFAVALEGVAAEFSARASEQCDPHSDLLKTQARKHNQRAQELERLRQERLNEVVLQPISGMDRAEYVPALDLPADAAGVISAITGLENHVARFYEDAADNAANVLTGVDRKLRKLAAESRKFAAALEAESEKSG
jgi:hypothetical protein